MPDCATWWFDHVGHTYMYVLATKNKDPRLQAQEADRLMAGAQEWGKLLGSPESEKLMAEHVLGAKNLADSAFLKDQNGISLAVESLLANAKEQSNFYASIIPDFPVKDFDDLFTLHLTATGGYILALSQGDMNDFRSNYNTVLQNRNALARFWGLLCLRLKK